MSGPIGRTNAIAELPADLELATRPKERPAGFKQPSICAVCGQTFDLEDLAQAHHHNAEPHARL